MVHGCGRRASFNSAPTRTDGLLPALAGTDSPVSNFGVVSHEPDWKATGTVTFLASPRLLLSGRAGYSWSDVHTDNVRSAPTYVFQFSNVGLLDVPLSLQRVTGFTTDTNDFDSANASCTSSRLTSSSVALNSSIIVDTAPANLRS